MSQSAKSRLIAAALLLFAAAVFLPGINWGLPSRAVDPYLFGDTPVWSGKQILELSGGWDDDPTRGADVDINPLATRGRAVWLNETDQQRAEIIRRYRLFSYQPDEMITFRSLAKMKPKQGDFDPRLYQYGGLWIYPVGVMLRLASVIGFVHLTSDLSYYLDHPEAFGRFYIVARFYTVIWALAGVWAVWWLARRIAGGGVLIPVAAAGCYILMPVVVNMAHEAKPHLPGAVLMLLAVITATRFVETGSRRWWLATGALCGAALGMVLSSLFIFILIPVMTLLRRMSWRQRLGVTLAAAAVGAAVYCIANPYVPINLAINRELLRSNLRNSTAMYEMGRWLEGTMNAADLMREGMSLVLFAVGVAGMLLWLARRRRGISPAILLLAAPSALLVLQFIALAAGKPGEYARFALFPDIALAVAGVTAIGHLISRPRPRAIVLSLLLVATSIFGMFYLWGFIRDSRAMTSRLRAAQQIEQLHGPGVQTVLLAAEPAPYSFPPADLFRWKWVLGPSAVPDVIVIPSPRSEQNLPTAISWADKRFVIRLTPRASPGLGVAGELARRHSPAVVFSGSCTASPPRSLASSSCASSGPSW